VLCGFVVVDVLSLKAVAWKCSACWLDLVSLVSLCVWS
jgi:hypothetical protein